MKQLGHLLEYLHHFYDIAIHDADNTYYCIVGENFETVKDVFDWEKASNVSIISVEDSSPFHQKKIFCKSIANCQLLKRYVKQYRIDTIFLPFMAEPMPLLPFYLTGLNVKVVGIVYDISYYYPNRTRIRRLRDHIINIMYARCSNIKTVFLLNGEAAVKDYNKRYHTKKFLYLPDPFCEKTDVPNIDIRDRYQIGHDITVFALFGLMNKGKNIENIAKAFATLPEDVKKKCCLITAGDVHESYKESFKHLYEIYKNAFLWISEPRFMPVEFISGLVNTASFIFMTYPSTGRSSGMFGYASSHSTPVIASSGGMVEDIIKKYNLGYCLEDISDKGVRDFIISHYQDNTTVGREYVNDHSLSKFKELICKAIF